MSPLLDTYRERLARAEVRLAYVRTWGANSEVSDEVLDMNDEAAELVKEINDLHQRIKATEANEQRAEKGARR